MGQSGQILRKRPARGYGRQDSTSETRHERACPDSLLICRNPPRFPGEPGARPGSLRPKLGPLSCRRRRKNPSPDTLYTHPGHPTPGTDAVPCICGQSARLGVCPGHPAPASKRPVEGAGRLLRRDQERPFISDSARVSTPCSGPSGYHASPKRHRHSSNRQTKPCAETRQVERRNPLRARPAPESKLQRRKRRARRPISPKSVRLREAPAPVSTPGVSTILPSRHVRPEPASIRFRRQSPFVLAPAF